MQWFDGFVVIKCELDIKRVRDCLELIVKACDINYVVVLICSLFFTISQDWWYNKELMTFKDISFFMAICLIRSKLLFPNDKSE